MNIHQIHVAIVGGGPAGLTLARLLQQQGANVNVFERDHNREARVQGTTLDLHTDAGLKALESAGLLDAFKANYLPHAGILRIADKHSKLHVDEHIQMRLQDIEGFGHDHFRPEIDRGPLRNILLDSLQPNTVVWDSRVVSLEPAGDGWKLELQNGRTVTADLVVAADGANSKLRSLLTSIVPMYSGVTVIEGVTYDAAKNTSRVYELIKGGKLWVLDEDKTIMFAAKGDGSISFYIGFNASEDWIRTCGLDFKNGSQLLGWFKRECSGWSDVWHELFTNEHSTYMPRQIISMPIDQHWKTRANLTMIGDAAHVMPPYAGEGVNVAMLDALRLSEHLTNPEFPDLYNAIAAFEHEMCNRAKASVEESLANTAMFHSPGALELMVGAFAN